jgi:hypothetical protein
VERPKLNDASWDETFLRDVAERLCLVIIYNLVQKHGPNMLLEAGFVEKWLAKQDWGDGEEERRKNFAAYRKSRLNNLLRDIIDIIFNCHLGVWSLRKARLVRVVRRVPQGRRRPGLSTSSSSDTHEEIAAEVRRRRREAIVIHDGDGPLNHGDIIQRIHRRTTEDYGMV